MITKRELFFRFFFLFGIDWRYVNFTSHLLGGLFYKSTHISFIFRDMYSKIHVTSVILRYKQNYEFQIWCHLTKCWFCRPNYNILIVYSVSKFAVRVYQCINNLLINSLWHIVWMKCKKNLRNSMYGVDFWMEYLKDWNILIIPKLV